MQPPPESEKPVAPFPLDDVLSGEDKDAIRNSISDLLGDQESDTKPTYHPTSIPEFENAPPRTTADHAGSFITEGPPAESSPPAFLSKPPAPYEAATSSALQPEDFLTTAPAAAAAAAAASAAATPLSTPSPKPPSKETVSVEVPIAPPSENSAAVKAAENIASPPPSKAGATLAGLLLTTLGLAATALLAYLFSKAGKTPQDLSQPTLAIPLLTALTLAFGTVATGLGSITLKPWARTLALAGCWVAVTTGILLLIKILLTPTHFEAPPFPGITPTTFAAAALVLIPGLLSLYFGAHRTTRLFHHHHPHSRPPSAPIIGSSLFMAIAAAGLATLALHTTTTLPLFAGEISPTALWIATGLFALASIINLRSTKLAWFLVLLPITALLARCISTGLTFWQDATLPARQAGLFTTGTALGLFLYHAAIAPLYGKRAK